jgi:hypothetical protein
MRAVGLVTPALALCFLLLLLLVHDVFFSTAAGEDNIPIDSKNPRVQVWFDNGGKDEKGEQLTKSMRFGVMEARSGNQLTYDKYGQTNSTVLRVDGAEVLFGAPSGKWLEMEGKSSGAFGGTKSVWFWTDAKARTKLEVTQLVEIIPGEPVEDAKGKGKLKRYLDTVRVRYLLENKGHDAANVGLRMVLDTLIGSNDGVPFTVPGRSDLVVKMAEFATPKEVPDFVQVLERPDLKNPGVVAFVNFKLGGEVEPPSRVLLTQWPSGKALFRWDVDMRPFDGDSAVVMYWNEKSLKPGLPREVGFSYGLGGLSVSSNGRLGVSVGGSFTPRGSLTVVALVNSPVKGETLELKLPPGLKLIGEAKQKVPAVAEGAQEQSPVTWHIHAEREGTFTVEVHSSANVSQKKSITIKTKTLW